jgi:hypothetical protein
LIVAMAQPLSRRVKSWLASWFQRTPADHYELQAGKLVHCRGDQRCECVDPGEIDSWWVDREPVYDVVHIRLRSGKVLDWQDMEYDLLPLLTRCGIAQPNDATTLNERIGEYPTVESPYHQ